MAIEILEMVTFPDTGCPVQQPPPPVLLAAPGQSERGCSSLRDNISCKTILYSITKPAQSEFVPKNSRIVLVMGAVMCYTVIARLKEIQPVKDKLR